MISKAFSRVLYVYMYQVALISEIAANAFQQARLEKLGDLHRGMSVEEVQEFFVKAGFKLAYVEGELSQSGRFEIWGLPEMGVAVAGAADKSGHHHYTMYLQWSPNRLRMTEIDEGDVTEGVRSALGGSYSGGYFNPNRPTLHHGKLHYPNSYPECTKEEAEIWGKPPYAAPESAEKERGQWIMAIHSFVNSGVLSPIIGLQGLEGKFITPWKSGCGADMMVEKMLGKYDGEGTIERRLNAIEPWFKEMIQDALIGPEQAQELLNARKLVALKLKQHKPEA